MKKLSALILTLVMVLTFVACGDKTVPNDKITTDSITENEEITEDATFGEEETDLELEVDSLETLELGVNEYVEKATGDLTKLYENLKNGITTYDKYKSNTERIETFYMDVLEVHQKATIKLREFALAYAKTILNSNSSTDEKYDEMEELYDVIYEEAGDNLYDEIYDGILKDMYDVYYDGILEDAQDSVEYSEWLDLRTDEYEWWLDARSDVYEDWLDFRSEVYEFWLNIRSELWDDDIENIKKEITDFSEDIKKLKEE